MKSLIFVIILLMAPTLAIAAETSSDEEADAAIEQVANKENEISSKEDQLKKLNEEISELKESHASATTQADIAAEVVQKTSNKIQTTELELEKTAINIQSTKDESAKITSTIETLEQQLESIKDNLGRTIKLFYQADTNFTFLNIILGSENLSTYLNERKAYKTLQEKVIQIISDLYQRQEELNKQKAEHIQKEQDLIKFQGIQSYQRTDLISQKQEQKVILGLKQEEQATYKHKIAEAEEARKEIEQNIFSLKGVGLELSLDDAFAAAKFASSVTGVRPALLLAILKVETNVGQNLGSGKFPDDMLPVSRPAFLRLTEKLGLDPNDPSEAPISKRPTSLKGWGGAMGPGQFMPDTWERIESRVADLMKNPQPNPYILSNAIVGTGIMLADRGASDPAKEVEAISRYIAGPNWQYHTWYADRVLAVAAEYEKESF